MTLSNDIKDLDQEQTYKYLKVNEKQCTQTQHASTTEKIRGEYIVKRVRAILKTEVKVENRISAINTLEGPVVSHSHSFNIINWNLSEKMKLGGKTRKLLASNKLHHPKADADCLYLPRSSRCLGMTQLQLPCKTSTTGMSECLKLTKGQML